MAETTDANNTGDSEDNPHNHTFVTNRSDGQHTEARQALSDSIIAYDKNDMDYASASWLQDKTVPHKPGS